MIGIGRPRRAATVGTLVLGLVVALGGCGKVATNDSVEDQIKSQLGTDSADARPTQGEVGQSIVCKATKGDAPPFDVKVTVTSVEGRHHQLRHRAARGSPTVAPAAPRPRPDTAADVAPAARRRPSTARTFAESVFDELVSNGKQVNEVSCPDLTAPGRRVAAVHPHVRYRDIRVTVTVTSVQGTDVKFDIQVDETRRVRAPSCPGSGRDRQAK